MVNTPPASGLYDELADAPPPLEPPGRVLAIGAHPDDIEFGAGGTIAKWSAAGAEVVIVITTDGSKGSWDPDTEPTELAERRAAEQRAAARELGVARIVQLGHVDGELEYSRQLRIDMATQIRLQKPDVVLSHDPWQRYQMHPDHRATGFAVTDGVVSARDHLFHPELGLEAHRPAALLLWSADAPDHYEPIDETVERKIAALLCHASQGTTTMGGAETNEEAAAAFAARIRERAIDAGAKVGLGPVEPFKRITP